MEFLYEVFVMDNQNRTGDILVIDGQTNGHDQSLCQIYELLSWGRNIIL